MEYTCKKCGHKWKPRTNTPSSCPSCRCKNWSNYNIKKGTVKVNNLMIFSSKSLGELLIIMCSITTYGKNYTEYIDKTEQQISKNLQQLEILKLVKSKWEHRKKIYELKKTKLAIISKKYILQKLEKAQKDEIAILENLTDFLKISTYREKNKMNIWVREKDIRIYRNKTIEQIKKRTNKQMEIVEYLFLDLKFENFLNYYLYLIYPNTKISFSSVIDNYLKWGELE